MNSPLRENAPGEIWGKWGATYGRNGLSRNVNSRLGGRSGERGAAGEAELGEGEREVLVLEIARHVALLAIGEDLLQVCDV
mgnify:CR=1 FL=1